MYVCENPRVREAAIDAGSRRALVCSQGEPAVVVAALLRSLADSGSELHYHGDFDWPGITIANLMVGNYRCQPWQYGSDHYLAALAGLASVVAELRRSTATPSYRAGTRSSRRRWRALAASSTRNSY